MAFNFTGRVTKIYPIKSGISTKNQKEWKSQQFVVEEESGEYPQSVAFSAFGDDKIAHIEQISIGSLVCVHFSIKANESEKGHFNNLNAYKVERLDAPTVQKSSALMDILPQGEESEGDLPF